MNDALKEFLDAKNVADPIRSAFVAYCRSLYSSRYLFRMDGDTIKLFMDRMTEDQLNQAWAEFTSDMRKILPTILS